MDQKAAIFRSLAWMEERIEEKLTVEAVAGSIPLSKYYYQRIFREAVGDSVMSYLTRRRLSLAAGELARTKASVLEIALKYGYDSHEGFSRSFKAHMGVTPTEYRKYQLFAACSDQKGEGCVMYSRTTEEILKELNGMIVQAREVAEASRSCRRKETELPSGYVPFWKLMADKVEKTADQLTELLERVTVITQCPDKITVRFLIIKAVEDAAFQFNVIAFQAGLTTARTIPEYRPVLQPLSAKYNALAEKARIGAGRIAEFFQELVALIFKDMREQAEQKLWETVQAGRTAGEALSDQKLPYRYLSDGMMGVTERLTAMPLEEITLYFLEEQVVRLDIMLLAAETDLLREPLHKTMFDGLMEFRQKLGELLELFKGFPSEEAEALFSKKEEMDLRQERTEAKKYQDLVLQESVLLFYLKGEAEKLAALPLEKEQAVSLERLCERLGKEVEEATDFADERTADKIFCGIEEAAERLERLGEDLGLYGGALLFLAKEFQGLKKQAVFCRQK